MNPYSVFGLELCAHCGAPYCRDCGEHSRWSDSIDRPGWPGLAGWECECGWAIEEPRYGSMPWPDADPESTMEGT